ncbi:MAG: hypothetical protein E6J34_18520 [Chloroflexi bacterium]|nr:MAG: hypothetical protein E6J34_18520 [Chloroflexota bacterium]
MNKQWLHEREIRAIWIPKLDIEDLTTMDREEQRRWFAEDLQLQELIEQVEQPISVQKMDGNDTETLAQIIESLPQLIDNPGRGWRILLEGAGLKMICNESIIQGTASQVARELIRWLKIRARLPEKQECEVLGWLLLHILKFPNISSAEQEAIKRITRKHQLIPDLWPL